MHQIGLLVATRTRKSGVRGMAARIPRLESRNRFGGGHGLDREVGGAGDSLVGELV